jgi:hypothetical protein
MLITSLISLNHFFGGWRFGANQFIILLLFYLFFVPFAIGAWRTAWPLSATCSTRPRVASRLMINASQGYIIANIIKNY